MFIVEEERGNGLGKFLLNGIMSHPELMEIIRGILSTEDAHDLHKKYGFNSLKKVENHMGRVVKND